MAIVFYRFKLIWLHNIYLYKHYKTKQKLNFNISTELLVQIENNPKTNRHEHLIRIRASDKCEIVL